MDNINCLRLPVTNDRLRKCSHSESIKYSPKQTKLPFLQHKHHHQQQEQQTHSEHLETPFIAYNQIHRTHSKRWQQQQSDSHRKHHHQHHPQQPRYQTKLNELYSDTEHTDKNFSKKFSFTQHSNHISRFYMIFVIFIIYLLDKINCDQGKRKCGFQYSSVVFNIYVI